MRFTTNNIAATHFDHGEFIGNGFLGLGLDTSLFNSVFGNNFGDFRVDFRKASSNSSNTYLVEENSFNKQLFLIVDELNISNTFRWTQWENKVLSSGGYDMYLKYLIGKDDTLDYDELYINDTVF